MTIDHENFARTALPIYDAVAQAYRLIATAYAQAAVLAETADVEMVAAYLDASEGAEQYADHCAEVAHLAGSDEPEEVVAAYDREHGPGAQRYATIQIGEAAEGFAETYNAEALWQRHVAATAHLANNTINNRTGREQPVFSFGRGMPVPTGV